MLPGWCSMMAVTLFIGGIILIMLGIIGEYLGRTYEETKRRPLYLIERGKPRDQNNRSAISKEERL